MALVSDATVEGENSNVSGWLEKRVVQVSMALKLPTRRPKAKYSLTPKCCWGKKKIRRSINWN